MKKINYILVSVGLVTIFAIVLFFMTSFSKDDAEETRDEHNHVSFVTNSIPIPKSVKFCDKDISLERIDMRERFDREINTFTYLHSTTMLYLKRANRFFPIIEPILKANNIPDDFKYLCVIESNLDTRAYSPAKAAGLWQFLESTGKSYGLEITSQVDERYHVEKATEAACKYFQDAYRRYGDWATVAASYNAGMGRISSSLEEQKVETAFDLLLVSETSRYVFRIMAIKQVFENPKKYGFHLRKGDLYKFVPVTQKEIRTDIADLAQWAKEQGLNYMQLKDFNVWLRGNSLKVATGKTYKIAIPEKDELYY